MRFSQLPSDLICAITVAAALSGSARAEGSAAQTHAGDILRFAIPAATLGAELLRGEREGALQYSEALVVTLAGTEVLKRTTHVQRPDKSTYDSFPSGHASSAFSAATYVHRRYGLETALPLYVLGTYVGYTRVQAHRHRWLDVAGSAAVSGAASWCLVEPRADRRVLLIPEFGPHGIGVQIVASW